MDEHSDQQFPGNEKYLDSLKLRYILEPWKGYFSVVATNDVTGICYEVFFRNKDRANKFIELDGFKNEDAAEVHQILLKRLWR